MHVGIPPAKNPPGGPLRIFGNPSGEHDFSKIDSKIAGEQCGRGNNGQGLGCQQLKRTQCISTGVVKASEQV